MMLVWKCRFSDSCDADQDAPAAPEPDTGRMNRPRAGAGSGARPPGTGYPGGPIIGHRPERCGAMNTTATSPLPPSDSEIVFAPARDLVRRLRERRLGAEELMSRFLARIEEVNPAVNAIVTLDPEAALEGARAADAALARGGEPAGPLHGLPIAVKDLTPTRGIRTTFGSPIYRDFVPDEDALYVERLKAAGAIVIGKTNTPEFGAGSQTFNPVFGATKNPYATGRTCGGSSGGAAVAVACGMLPLADGTDMGGSLRNPASWANVVGFRTSPGRVPVWPRNMLYNPLGVAGPIARHVADAALLLSAMAGPDPRVPLSIEQPGSRFREPLERDFQGVRIAWSPTLGGYPVDPAVLEVCGAAAGRFGELGCAVEEADPDLRGADEIFQTLRAFSFAMAHEEHLRLHRGRMKDTVVWNTEKGIALGAMDVARAETKRAALLDRVVEFFGRFDYLVCPATQVPPFPVEMDWVREINGVRLETYIDWMAACYAITVTGCPSISVPAGFTADGLPVGIQIVAPPKRDFEALQLAHAYEGVARFAERRPPL